MRITRLAHFGSFLVLTNCGQGPTVEASPPGNDDHTDVKDGGTRPGNATEGDGGSDPIIIPPPDEPDDAGATCTGDASECGPLGPTPEPACGDGRINVAGETCDDGNGVSADGCTATCTLEADYACPTPGEPCVSTVECGDGKITGSETCDDGNAKPGDGCDADCTQEPGWACQNPGLACRAAECGDQIVAGNEECDFGDGVDGCESCRIEDGYDCTDSGCAPTECGNGSIERGEQCEDGNQRPFDGCYACKAEPECEGGVCMAVCGDGQRYDGEGCDDGNTRDGDGCSATCVAETGFYCTDVTGEPPTELNLPVIFRDFIGKGHSNLEGCYDQRAGEQPTDVKTKPCFHPNFNQLSGTNLQGVVESELGDDGTPDMDCPGGDCSGNPGVQTDNFTNNDDFDDWYDDTYEWTKPIYRELTLTLQDGLTYTFTPPAIGFYPIDDAGWVTVETGRTDDQGEPIYVEWKRQGNDGGSCDDGFHNYSFSTETRFIFEYQGGERFDFNGDDDLWVFVNGKLAIDLSGLHGPRAGSFELDADTDDTGADVADGTALVDNPLIDPTTVDLGLDVGGVYEVALFHAERNYCGSNFELTLKDFNKPQSECESLCGDGVVASDELCDEGEESNDGSYGHCAPDCLSRGPHCGDGVTSEDDGEQCDDGVNLSTYGDGCAPGCKLPPNCGDGIVQSRFEDCDDESNDGGYGECAAGCVLGPYCGDGKVDKSDAEQCDDANRENGDGCNVNCKDEGTDIR